MRKPEAPSAGAPLEEWLRWQETLHPKAIELGLDRVRAVAGRLGLPAPGIRTLTVAGTNGKGSSTALLAEIYRAAGYRVGAYTSPHLYRYNERIAVDGMAVADAELCRAFAEVEAARGETPLTYFEFGTLAALRLLREAHVDVQVLEVGLGGRLDAVNLVDADGALITNIGLDHTDWLGPDRESIGREKAGILRSGRPAVCADPDPPGSIAALAGRVGASIWWLGRDFHWQAAGDAWSWSGGPVRYKKLPPPGLAGSAQFRNAAGAIALVARMQPLLPVAETALRAALPRLRLPGRFERRGRVVLDVAHNVEAARVLADNLAAAGMRDVVLVLGMLQDKPVEEFCRVLAPQVRHALCVSLSPPRGLAALELRARARRGGLAAEIAPDMAEALRQARRLAGEGWIVVCGSFLTVAAAGDLRG